MPRAPAQNFGACLELAKKNSRKAYGEKKEAFDTLKGLSGRYIYAAEAASKGIDGFSRLLQEGGLTGFVESCETPLTIFAPTNEAILAVGNTLPADTQLLRELLRVHITMGSLRWVLRGPSAKNCE